MRDGLLALQGFGNSSLVVEQRLRSTKSIQVATVTLWAAVLYFVLVGVFFVVLALSIILNRGNTVRVPVHFEEALQKCASYDRRAQETVGPGSEPPAEKESEVWFTLINIDEDNGQHLSACGGNAQKLRPDARLT